MTDATTNNSQMRAGFTMIELIFVIVIIGILASVAIPRLAATRDDAKIATALSETGMILRETTSYYTANGHFDDVASNMSNVADLNASNTGTVDATISSGGRVFYYSTPKNGSGTERCIQFTINNIEGNVTIAPVTGSIAGTGNVCRGIKQSSTFLNDLNGTHLVGGSNVSF